MKDLVHGRRQLASEFSFAEQVSSDPKAPLSQTCTNLRNLT